MVDREYGANLTSCQGSTILVDLPEDVTQGGLPPNYQAYQQIPGFSALIHKILKCGKVAVDGRDIGHASILLTTISLRPSPARPLPAGWGEAFVLEIGSDSSNVSEFFARGLVAPWATSASHNVDSTPLWVEAVTGKVTRAGSPLYQFESSPDKGATRRSLSIRYYTGANHTIGFFDLESAYLESSGSGPAHLSAASGTALSRIAGVTEAAGFGNRYHDLNMLFSFQGKVSGNETG